VCIKIIIKELIILQFVKASTVSGTECTGSVTTIDPSKAGGTVDPYSAKRHSRIPLNSQTRSLQ